MLLINEIKLILTGYKRILAGIVVLAFFCFLAVQVSHEVLKQKYLFQPFTIGIVDRDNTAEINILIEMFKNTQSIASLITLEKLDEVSAKQKLQNDLIPAFVVIPKNFTQGIITGENPPLILVGNEKKMLELTATKLLLSAGVAFVTSSQSGIYSTIDFASEHGVDWDVIQTSIVLPINVEYMKAILSHKDYFAIEKVSATGNIPIASYYLHSLVFFLLGIFIIVFRESVVVSDGVVARFRICGVGFFQIVANKLIALFLVIAFITLPLSFVFGVKFLAVVWFLSSLTVFAAGVFKEQLSNGLFLFTVAILSLLVSGGLLPLSYLPKVFGFASVLFPHYWFIHMGEPLAALVFIGYGFILYLMSALVLKVRCNA